MKAEYEGLTFGKFKALLTAANLGAQAMDEVEGYKVQRAQDSVLITSQQSQIAALKTSVQSLAEESDGRFRLLEKKDELITSKDKVINIQQESIAKMVKKDKRFGLSAFVGYGWGNKVMPDMMNTMHFMPSVGIGFSYLLIRL